MVCLTFKKNDTNTISDALKALGKENLALIIHGSSFPAKDGEDTGFGSFNSESGHALIDYASKIFNAIQLGPAGKTKSSDSSPYCGTIFSGNPLFIDLKQLTEKEWGEILSIESYKKVVRENPKQNSGRTAYSYISKAQLEALKEAWNNFKGTKLLKKELKRVLFCATGALLSTVSSQQGESIPSICHIVEMENE
jgi:4-alpha-glucanotransferase